MCTHFTYFTFHYNAAASLPCTLLLEESIEQAPTAPNANAITYNTGEELLDQVSLRTCTYER